MEDKKKKKEESVFLKALVIIIVFIVLIISLVNGGLDSDRGVVVSIFAGVFILAGLINIFKPKNNPSKEISNSMDQSSEKTFDTLNIPDSVEIEHNKLSPSSLPGKTSLPHNTSTQTSIPSGNSFADKAKAWINNIPPKKRPFFAFGIIMVIVVIIIVITFVPRIGTSDTTITGTWTHEIGNTTLQDEHTWVMNLSNWNVDTYYDSGIIYMYVNEDGTFTVFYNDMLICQGTWEANTNYYEFHQVDPEGILLGMYSDYEIKGLKLYEGRYAVFEKE